MDFWNELDRLSRKHDVLRHPFYLRWSAGTLSREELGTYAGQYRHAVTALATASRRAANLASGEERRHLSTHADEEFDHIELWADFARAVDADAEAEPTLETRECLAAWDDPERDLDETLTAVYAIESTQPEIAGTKLAGLPAYGLKDPRDTAYFEVHQTADIDHASAGKDLIDRRGASARPELISVAERVWSGNWRLLDGVERLTSEGARR